LRQKEPQHAPSAYKLPTKEVGPANRLMHSNARFDAFSKSLCVISPHQDEHCGNQLEAPGEGGDPPADPIESPEGLPNRPANVREPPMERSATPSRQALVPAAHGWRAVRPIVKLWGGTGQQETSPDNIFELVQDWLRECKE
jgi:hypothetical protein